MSGPGRPRRCLLVRQPFAGYIVDGLKSWEIRKSRTKVAGPVGIVAGGYLIGQVRIDGVLGPFTAGQLGRYYDKHLAGDDLLADYAGGKDLWAWQLSRARRYAKAVPVARRRGPVVWMLLEDR